MKRLFLYTTTAILGLSLAACNTDVKKNDVAANTENKVELEKPVPPAVVIPEGYKLYKSGALNKEWKLSMIYPEKASVDVVGNQVMVKYSGEDNSFYGGLTDGFNMTVSIVNNEDSQKYIQNTTPELIGNYEMFKYKAPNSLGMQVDHYLVKINTEDETESAYVDVALAVKGKDSKEYNTMILDILETMQWEKAAV
ncbi:hypothetical protein [Leeuwenhoekiella sp. NPDC079379]|uniref:hypothetical protein n=1 Tax=Leeuwenhoekiella sp. NPDC079379 TaxID=3364122 RepID=UPI0037C9C45F